MIEMKKSFKRNPPWLCLYDEQISQISISGRFGVIRIEIQSSLTIAQRRAIFKSFFSQMKPWLRYFDGWAGYNHEGSGWADDRKMGDAWQWIWKAKPIPIETQDTGFRIRMARLEKGWTQTELSRRSGVSRKIRGPGTGHDPGRPH